MKEKLIYNSHIHEFTGLEAINKIGTEGFYKTGNKFNVNFSFSKGYLSNIRTDCELNQSDDNVIWIERFTNRDGSLQEKWVRIYHSDEKGIRIDITNYPPTS